MCLESFGIVDETIPCQCINPKCLQNFCTKCVRDICHYNGEDKRFQCAYCLKKYERNCCPKENELWKKKLWEAKNIEYGIKHTEYLLQTKCDPEELKFDIDCRQRQLLNLLSTHQRVCNKAHSNAVDEEVENMVNQLANILLDLSSCSSDATILFKAQYEEVISQVIPEKCNFKIGARYISLCERLKYHTSNDEFSSIFPSTQMKMNEWLCKQKSGDEFHPKILHLIEAIEKDLISQWSNPKVTPSVKIGFLGYTNAGKSSLVNRLLGVSSLSDAEAAPVRSMKTTYFSVPLNRQQPLIYSSVDRTIQIPVTLVDIQGQDKNRQAGDNQHQVGNYQDEIKKASCDIYILVFDDELDDEQKRWLTYIQNELKRTFVLVKSKVDIPYLKKMRELSGKFYSRTTLEERNQYHKIILNQIEHECQNAIGKVFLTATDYEPSSADTEELLNNESFDYASLLNMLTDLAFDTRNPRIHELAVKAAYRVINTCFRRGYVINVMKYKIASGVAAIIPLVDLVPRHLSREAIRKAFGIDDELCEYVKRFNLTIEGDDLKTKSFDKSVLKTKSESKLDVNKERVLTVTRNTVSIAGTLSDDAARVAALGATTAAHTALAATLVAGVVFSAGMCAWAAVSSGKHIFSFVNRTCDDCLLIMDYIIESIIERQKSNTSTNIHPRAPNSN